MCCTRGTGLYIGVLVSSNEGIPAPTLKATPEYPFYFKGETVTLTCNTQEYRHAHFSFYKNSQYIPSENKYTYKINAMDDSDVGIYACDFWARSRSSPRSNEVSLFYFDKLPSPVIYLDPSRSVYSMGESVTIVCSPPMSKEVKRITFNKEGNVQPLKEANGNTYVISTSTREDAGRYSCTYSVEIQERWVTSFTSDYIIVNVSVSTARTTATTKIPETSAPDMTSKKRTIELSTPTQRNKVTNSAISIAQAVTTTIPLTSLPDMTDKTREIEMFSTTQSNKVTNSTSYSKVPYLIHIYGGGLFLIVTFVLIKVFFLIYFTRKRQREGTMVELPVSEPDLKSSPNLKTIVQTSLCPTSFQDMEAEHFYSEIELPNVKAASPIISMYAKAKAIDPLPSVYQTDLTSHARK
ncbi:uncharacterized protein LOC130277429 isoform X2 [Hyla sarda]|uniref:uncharacterized protein LOC130277429 isoform X2 n=1 Tax=Hyla sarda TaxID=327740 RepID=UPI0024C2D73C|nr:uncharacterized protein LOC130277429 isoform X2 [Hyla sarda]